MDDRTRDSSNTAIFAIVALILVAVLVFILFFRPGPATEADEPDLDIRIETPEGGAVEGDGGEGGGGAAEEGDTAP